jgi:hypothetical protein
MRSHNCPFTLSLGECPDDVGKGGEVDASSGLRSLDGKRDGEVAFAGAGRAEEVDYLVAIDEVELGKGKNPVAVEGRLEREVESGERLDGWR